MWIHRFQVSESLQNSSVCRTKAIAAIWLLCFCASLQFSRGCGATESRCSLTVLRWPRDRHRSGCTTLTWPAWRCCLPIVSCDDSHRFPDDHGINHPQCAAERWKKSNGLHKTEWKAPGSFVEWSERWRVSCVWRTFTSTGQPYLTDWKETIIPIRSLVKRGDYSSRR